MRPLKFDKLHHFLGHLYFDSCGHESVHLDAPQSRTPEYKKVKAAFAKAVKHVHSNKGFTGEMMTAKPVKALIHETFNVLKEAISTEITQEVPEEMRRSLEQDVFVFSGMKTYTQLKEVSSLLHDDSGNVKPLHKFREDVLAIDKTYNERYLEAEHQFATTSAQMAAKWVSYEKDGNRYDLQYRTAGDSKVRPAHQVLHNITLPPDHPMWSIIFPPNGWKCRCNAVQVLKGKYPVTDDETAAKAGEKATTVLDKDGNNKADIFRFNPGKDKVIFPPHHPYSQTKENSKNPVQQDKVAAKKAVQEMAKNR